MSFHYLLFIILITPLFAFLQVKGDQIVDADKEIYLQGFALTNGMFANWDNVQKQPILPERLDEVSWSLQNKDFKNLDKLNANCVRYCVNYEIFARDNSSRTENFEILSDQLKKFKDAGIYVILNLHIPPGRANSIRPKADSFLENKSYWQEFEEFWVDILEKYKDNETIAGWEFFNEPQVPENMSLKEFHKSIDGFLKRMRTLDQKHIFFVCYPHSKVRETFSDQTKDIDWSFLPFHKYSDPNIVYVAHFYEPIAFSHQGFGTPRNVSYPANYYQYKKYLSSSSAAYSGTEKNWHYYISEQIKPSDDIDYGTPYLAGPPDSGNIFFDDITVWEIEPNGSKKKLDLPNPSFKPETPVYPDIDGQKLYNPEDTIFWTTYYSEKYERGKLAIPYYQLSAGGRTDKHSVLINNTEQPVANWQTDPAQFCIIPKPGCLYQIEGYAKASRWEDPQIGISWYQGTKVSANKTELENYIKTNYLGFKNKYNVPIIVTEFGSMGCAPEESRLAWTKDVIEIFHEYGLHNTYWCYNDKHGWGIDFAVYLKNPFQLDQEYYTYKSMEELLKQEFKKHPR